MNVQKKRTATEFTGDLKRHTAQKPHGEEDLVFEDPFGDDMEDEEMVENDSDEDIIDNKELLNKDVDMDDPEQADKQVKKVFVPGVDKLQDDEVLDYDSSAYDMYYAQP